MSATVLLIAAAHAVPILVTAHYTDSRVLTSLAGIVMGVIAITIGSAAYAFADLVFVAIGAFVGISICKKDIRRQLLPPAPPAPPPPPQKVTTTLEERRAGLVRLAESNDVASQLELGELLLEGEIGQYWDVWFPRDIERSLYWIQRAMAGGQGTIHSFCRFFFDELTEHLEVNGDLLNQFVFAMSFAIKYDDNVENSTIYRELLSAQKALANSDPKVAFATLSALRSDYLAKHVKGG